MSAQLQDTREHQTYELLLKLKKYCTKDEFSLLCWLCGFRSNQFED